MKSLFKKLFLALPFFVILFLLVTPFAHAQDWNTLAPNCVDSNGVASLNCLPAVFSNIVRAAMMFVGTVAVFLLIWAGIKYIRSGGDPKQTQGARAIMTYAIIGLVLVLCSFGIINLIAYLTHAKCIAQLSFTACG